jgi:putative NIF3 family GTP cyclohydrolase 1 type 2
MKVAHVQYLPGAQDEVYQIKSLEREDVEVLVTGEVREWETVEYVRDAMLQKRHKALIMLGHEISEEAGMEGCARWLRTQFPGMRVNFISAGEPYWPVAQAAPAVHRVNHR